MRKSNGPKLYLIEISMLKPSHFTLKVRSIYKSEDGLEESKYEYEIWIRKKDEWSDMTLSSNLETFFKVIAHTLTQSTLLRK